MWKAQSKRICCSNGTFETLPSQEKVGLLYCLGHSYSAVLQFLHDTELSPPCCTHLQASLLSGRISPAPSRHRPLPRDCRRSQNHSRFPQILRAPPPLRLRRAALRPKSLYNAQKSYSACFVMWTLCIDLHEGRTNTWRIPQDNNITSQAQQI